MGNSNIKKILLVDDDPLALQIMQIHLSNSGLDLEVQTTEDGEEALKIIKSFQPTLIISDWEMPHMTGIELTRNIKADKEIRHIPVIIATGLMTTDNNLDQAFQAGAIDYVRKPVNEIELMARMRSVLELIESQERIRIQNEILKEHREELKAINTEVSEANVKLRESEIRYKHLAEATQEGIAICKLSGEVINHNTRLTTIFSTEKQNLLGENIHNWIPQHDFADNQEFHQDEIKYQVKEQQLTLNILTRKIEHEGEIAFIVTVRDITDAKRIEELKRQQLEERIEAEKEINRLQKEKYQADIDHKNRQLTSTTLQVNNKNKILEEIEGVLKELTDKSPSNPAKQYRQISMIIRDNKNLDKDWEQFQLHFEEVHPNFFEKLKTSYPNLTETDLKHCAYIRIGFSTKEIARLLNVTPRSVQVSRYRMKKKMELDESQDLRDMINMLK